MSYLAKLQPALACDLAPAASDCSETTQQLGSPCHATAEQRDVTAPPALQLPPPPPQLVLAPPPAAFDSLGRHADGEHCSNPSCRVLITGVRRTNNAKNLVACNACGIYANRHNGQWRTGEMISRDAVRKARQAEASALSPCAGAAAVATAFEPRQPRQIKRPKWMSDDDEPGSGWNGGSTPGSPQISGRSGGGARRVVRQRRWTLEEEEVAPRSPLAYDAALLEAAEAADRCSPDTDMPLAQQLSAEMASEDEAWCAETLCIMSRSNSS
jgi:hypothetical protein